MIQQLRNEAHRFGISHHRKRREKTAISSELIDIKGIGEKTKDYLLAEFGSVGKIREASLKELSDKIGEAKGNLVYNYFKEQ